MIINDDRIDNNWAAYKNDVQKRWTKLTNSHLEQINGNREKLAHLIQKQYGITRYAAEKQMQQWEKAYSISYQTYPNYNLRAD